MIAKAPLAARCGRCGRDVLEARDDWHQGVLLADPRIDPVDLSADQLLACVIAGIQVWQLHQVAGRWVTSLRSRYWPRRPVDGPIAPAHDCDRTWSAPRLNLAPDVTHVPDACPF